MDGQGSFTTVTISGVGTTGVSFNSSTVATLNSASRTNEEPRLRRNIAELESQINSQQARTKDLQRQLEELGKVNFTREELNFILSRVHPDKNPNSKTAHQLTQKLIKKRND